MRVFVATTLVPGMDLVGPLERVQSEVTVLRRVEDAAELLAVARSGTVDVLLMAGDLAPLSRGLLGELDSLPRPVGLVAVSEVSADRTRARALGVRTLRADVDPLELADALVAAARNAQTGLPHVREAEDPAADDAEPLPETLTGTGPDAGRVPEQAANPGVEQNAVADGGVVRPGHAVGGPGMTADAAQGRGRSASGTDGASADGASACGADASEARDPRSVGEFGSGDTAPEESGSTGAADSRQVHAGRSSAGGTAAAGPAATPDASGSSRPRAGRITAVWGPAGAPGRTTVAVNLAAEAAALGARVLLVDADTYAPAAGVLLGLTDESAGLAQAARTADRGRLDRSALDSAAVRVRAAGADLCVLTGLTRPERWPELRGAAVEEVMRCAREGWDEVVVDVGFCLEEDEELSFDIPAPQRNGATLAVLRAADRILAVGGGDSVGLPRLMRGVDALREAVPDGPEPEVVVNRVRPAASGTAPQSQITAVWRRFGPGLPITAFLPADPAACDRALLGGRLLAEAAPKSPLRKALRELADVGPPRTPGPVTVPGSARRSPLRRLGTAVAAALRRGRAAGASAPRTEAGSAERPVPSVVEAPGEAAGRD